MTKTIYTQDQIDQAKSISLIDYCNYRGIDLSGSETNPHLVEMDSLVIFPNNVERQWHRYSTQEGGDAISFVQYVENKSFSEAMEVLLDPSFENEHPIHRNPIKKEEFSYKNYEVESFDKAKDYLVNKRKIDPEIVDTLKEKGFIAQDQKNNIVFKWRNQLTHKICGANIQGTLPTKGRSYKRIQKNSTQGYGFNLLNGDPNEIFFFESSIDLLSYCSMNKGQLDNKWFVSMEGLKKNVVAQTIFDYETFRKEHNQPITAPVVHICTDTDQAGQEFYDKHFNIYPYMHYDPPSIGKDWNDELVARVEEKEKSDEQHQAFFIDKNNDYEIPIYNYDEELEI
ncbi:MULTISPECIES: DUF3991 domain-containing protein [Aerococcus]|uniref:DUF3991 domain-containing protein n=1 Tax=Aerococcus TaxID=1375 RepID=UPI0018A7A9C1|nr:MULTISPECIES: DUF3991 domain-containing protein [Aerococcus]MCY3067596.1 DUF3991 domain-containing protein [Aerococcus mictus]MCY3080869.1 DUF3991 domain-containing protein [Aerococcus mictus]MDK8485474.1 DUF3991 domain-containing protein [Aerococcus urinae]